MKEAPSSYETSVLTRDMALYPRRRHSSTEKWFGRRRQLEGWKGESIIIDEAEGLVRRPRAVYWFYTV
jgi:hypothetical protein